MRTVTVFLHMKTGLVLMGKYKHTYTKHCLMTLLLPHRAEGENPVLPSSVSTTKSEDEEEEDQFDDDHDEQCKYTRTRDYWCVM